LGDLSDRLLSTNKLLEFHIVMVNGSFKVSHSWVGHYLVGSLAGAVIQAKLPTRYLGISLPSLRPCPFTRIFVSFDLAELICA
jgi:hypothetical protein